MTAKALTGETRLCYIREPLSEGLNNDDGNFNENATFGQLSLLCDYSISFASCIIGEVYNNWIARSNVKVNTENERFTVVCSRCRQNASVVISLCFFGTWQRTVLEGVPQVQRAHFSSFDQSHS